MVTTACMPVLQPWIMFCICIIFTTFQLLSVQCLNCLVHCCWVTAGEEKFTTLRSYTEWILKNAGVRLYIMGSIVIHNQFMWSLLPYQNTSWLCTPSYSCSALFGTVVHLNTQRIHCCIRPTSSIAWQLGPEQTRYQNRVHCGIDHNMPWSDIDLYTVCVSSSLRNRWGWS